MRPSHFPALRTSWSAVTVLRGLLSTDGLHFLYHIIVSKAFQSIAPVGWIPPTDHIASGALSLRSCGAIRAQESGNAERRKKAFADGVLCR